VAISHNSCRRANSSTTGSAVSEDEDPYGPLAGGVVIVVLADYVGTWSHIARAPMVEPWLPTSP
jgi:lipocalin